HPVNPIALPFRSLAGSLAAALALTTAASHLAAQAAPDAEPGAWTTAQDHAAMLQQLGITKLRPGPSGRTGPDVINPANYDPTKANPFLDLPELLVAKDGTKITTPEQWWNLRRPEILADFEREVIGRVPRNVPKVTWAVTKNVNTEVGGIPVVAKQVIGHVDNSSCPAITVDIRMAVVTPAAAT